ncbi:coatomer subunit gamma-2-like [Hydractinia symbiolongicarpus]|uniref:coatomer subunit gamma-2-like n=1 Tax=Hydractinia symbiolongicarpus TaxID=13093 RepID=UPI002549CC88|nr:coatomer subunit gamma-2-like [Hydractinia symbiolongicarpus]
MNILKKDKKDEEGGLGNPFQGLDKSTVLQESRSFNDTPINTRKCIHILAKVLYLMNQGTYFGTTEATETFFAMTKLFQSKDVTLRRMCYLAIKELANVAEDVIIVTSSLTKDMTGKEDMFRASAIRALCKITDSQMLAGIERYLKQAIVDKNPNVSSAALVSSLHLLKPNFDVVKRWVNEAQEAASSENVMVQYHGLGLLYHIKQNDRLAVSKLITKQARQALRSPYAYCLLVRIAAKFLDEDPESPENAPLQEFLESCLRHKSELVIYEAARALVNLKNVKTKDLQPAVSVLQLFLSSPRPTLRFAAVRTLNKVAIMQPQSVMTCNLDLENLITDVNRSIATLAITTLLKTGSENSVDRLMKQISTFMSEISDEFKIVVVDAIRALCLKFPRKHMVMMNFLSSMLREEGGFDYKKAIVEAVVTIIEENNDAKETGLAHLCEFIEDCEHTSLATKILHLLGQEGPRTQSPSKYIRFIYNRVILENAEVRAAAVTSLAKFGAHCDSLLPSILVLLSRCMMDSDDEVRDRATFYYHVLNKQDKQLSSGYILNTLNVSVVGLERALAAYLKEPADAPFDMKTVPVATVPIHEQQKPVKTSGEVTSSSQKSAAPAATRQDVYAEQLAAVPEFASLGPLFKSSSKPIQLTESETEYVVNCVKHTFANHMVFQFNCTNTLNDQLLENVVVQMETGDEVDVQSNVPCAKLVYGTPGTTYTCVGFSEDTTQVTASFSCTLKFIVKDCDPNTGEPDDDEGYEDEYVLEDVEMVVADHVQGVVRTNFLASWDEVGDEHEMEDTFALSSMESLEEAVTKITHFMGLQPCERTDRVPTDKSAHTLLLAGVYRGGIDVMVRAKLALKDGVTMHLTVRSTDPIVSEVVMSAVG